jgi:hypothetical protein
MIKYKNSDVGIPDCTRLQGKSFYLSSSFYGRKKMVILSLKYGNYFCTYVLYSPVHNVLDACIYITRASGRGLGPGIREFFGPCEMASSR